MENVLKNFSISEQSICIGATVPTGFEETSCKEICEKVDVLETICCKGKVYFQVAPQSLSKLHQLRSVDNLFLIIKYYANFQYCSNKEVLLKEMTELPANLPWDEVVQFWRENQKFCRKKKNSKSGCNKKHLQDKGQTLEPSSISLQNTLISEPIDKARNKDQNLSDNEDIRFRVTANRVGKKQCITSPEAEFEFGGALQDLTQWKVDLSNYNLEVLLSLGIDSVMIGLSLTSGSLHHRNITHFGKTTLRSTICYNMLRLCDIHPGDVVIDPMCGVGSISLEGNAEWKEAFHLAGDIAHPAIVRCSSNVKTINKTSGVSKCNVDVLKWDATNLPLQAGAADVLITDLPFGRRMGSRSDNRKLYPAVLHEMARVTKLCTGRACLLTYDKRSIVSAISKLSNFWKCQKSIFINVGGLSVGLYLLRRTAEVTKRFDTDDSTQ